MTSFGTWVTLQDLKRERNDLKKLNPFKYEEDIQLAEERWEYFKKKVVVPGCGAAASRTSVSGT